MLECWNMEFEAVELTLIRKNGLTHWRQCVGGKGNTAKQWLMVSDSLRLRLGSGFRSCIQGCMLRQKKNVRTAPANGNRKSWKAFIQGMETLPSPFRGKIGDFQYIRHFPPGDIHTSKIPWMAIPFRTARGLTNASVRVTTRDMHRCFYWSRAVT